MNTIKGIYGAFNLREKLIRFSVSIYGRMNFIIDL